MSGVIVNYNNNALTSMSSSGTKTLLTSGKYCEGDFEVVYDGSTSYTATIYGNGDSNYCYVQYKGVKYYTDGQTFTFDPEDVIDFYAESNDGVEANINFGTGTYASSTDGTPATYSFTTIGCNIFIILDYDNTYGNYMGNITVQFLNDTFSDVRPELNLDSSRINMAVTPSTDYQYFEPASGYYGIAGFGVAAMPIGSTFPPAITITKNPTINVNTSGIVTASYTGSSSITPTVTSGYVSQGTAGTISTAGTSTYQLTSKAAQTYYPSTADQTIASQRWLTGAQTIKSVTTSNLTASNIAEGVVVKVGDVNNASRITQITGTHQGGGGFTADQIATRTIVGDISGSATNIENYAFYSCTSLTTASFPNVTSIGSYAFYSCASLTTASFPSATYIGNYAFQYCTSLTTASFSSVSSVGMSTFYACYALTTASLPKLTNIPNNMFGYCTSLTTASFPSVTNIGSSAFQYCYVLSTISFPNVRSIGSYAFRYCSSLTTVSFPNVTSIGNYAFCSCFNLLSFYLLGSSVPTLGINVFYSTPIGGYTTSTGGVYGSIFVPSSLYDQYIVATNWSAYSSRIVSV